MTRGTEFALSIHSVNTFFTTPEGVYFNNTSNYIIHKADLALLTISADSNPAKYISQSAAVNSYLTYDLNYAFKSIQAIGSDNNSHPFLSRLQFLGLKKQAGKALRCYINLPNFVKDLPITNGVHVTQIADNVVMCSRSYEESNRMSKAIMYTSPSYFNKSDFDRWIAEIIEVLL